MYIKEVLSGFAMWEQILRLPKIIAFWKTKAKQAWELAVTSEAVTEIGIFREISQVNWCSDGRTARAEGKLWNKYSSTYGLL